MSKNDATKRQATKTKRAWIKMIKAVLISLITGGAIIFASLAQGSVAPTTPVLVVQIPVDCTTGAASSQQVRP